MTTNKNIMAGARQTLQGKWNSVLFPTFAYMLLIGVCSFSANLRGSLSFSLFGSLGLLLLAGPLAIGFISYFMRFTRGEEVCTGDILSGFSQYGRSLGTYLLVGIYTLLWSLLFLIPGIIKSCSYAMTFYILNDDPQVGPGEAINRSMKMMEGHKWKFFCLSLRFIGWFILGYITLGIGFLWIIPYIQVSLVHFYEDLKGKEGVEEAPEITEITGE